MLELKISGMSCRNCTDSVAKALSARPGVTKVEVDLASGSARVWGPEESRRSELVAVIESLGFEAE